jgi:hypothetical protein
MSRIPNTGFSCSQGCGSAFISSGSGSSILGLNTDPDRDPIRIRIQGFNDQKLKKKITAEIFYYFFWDQKLQFTHPYASIRTSKLQKKPSALKGSHPTLQNMNFKNFSTFVGHFCPPGSGSTDPIESGSGSATLAVVYILKGLKRVAADTSRRP